MLVKTCSILIAITSTVNAFTLSISSPLSHIIQNAATMPSAEGEPQTFTPLSSDEVIAPSMEATATLTVEDTIPSTEEALLTEEAPLTEEASSAITTPSSDETPTSSTEDTTAPLEEVFCLGMVGCEGPEPMPLTPGVSSVNFDPAFFH